MRETIVVLSTCPSPAEAERIARALIERRLAACVQILPPMTSLYRWQGTIESAVESLLLIKSERAKFESLRQGIESLHPYEVPEIVALPAAAVSEKYAAWLGSELNA